MTFIWDPIRLVNLGLCIIILIYGFKNYKKDKNELSFYIGIAFGLFGISHLALSFGASKSSLITDLLIAVRTAAYLTVLFALYKFGRKRSVEN